jgi:hypothetical protein
MSARRLLVWLLLAAAGAALWASGRPRGTPSAAAIDWRREPIQEPTARAPFALETSRGEVRLRPRFAYDVAARVLGAERYRFDDLAFLSPVDLALAWGEAAEPEVVAGLDVSQSWRFYFWRTDAPDLEPERIIRHSANTHAIPATANVRRALLALDRGDEVRLTGLLVDVQGRDFRWHTSTVRTDHGDGGCEILWVEAVEAAGRRYR